MPRRERTYTGIFGAIQRLLKILDANKDELAHLEPFRVKLVGLMSEVLEVHQQQAVFRAGKQEATKRLQRLTGDGQKLASVVLAAVKEHYGTREEKIAEFGLQPYRGRKVKPAPEEPEPAEIPAPAGAVPVPVLPGR